MGIPECLFMVSERQFGSTGKLERRAFVRGRILITFHGMVIGSCYVFFFEYFAALWNTRRFQFYHLSVGIQNLLSQRRIADDIMDISCRYLT